MHAETRKELNVVLGMIGPSPADSVKRALDLALFNDEQRETADVSNKGLHDLHTVWAGQHLEDIRRALKHIQPHGNWNRTTPHRALVDARDALIRDNPAYQEAAWRLAASQRPIYEQDADCAACGWYEPLQEAREDAVNRLNKRTPQTVEN